MDERTARMLRYMAIAAAGGWLGWRVTPESFRSLVRSEFNEVIWLAFHPAPPRPSALPYPDLPLPISAGEPVTPTAPEFNPDTRVYTDLDLWVALRGCQVVYVTGKRGSGKTLLAMRLVELLRWGRSCFVVGMRESGSQLLPAWIGTMDTVEHLPNSCVAVIDEAYMQLHSMDRGGSKSAERSKLLNLSRQRNQLLIFIAQDGRQIDHYVIQATDAFLIKDPSPLQAESDRPELRSMFWQNSGEGSTTMSGRTAHSVTGRRLLRSSGPHLNRV